MATAMGQEEIIALMRETLGDNFTQLRVRRVVIEEDLAGESTSVTCEVTDEATQDSFVIASKGVGVIDAFFHGVVNRFANEYPSLNTIRFTSFSVGAKLDTKKEDSGTDSLAEVILEITNSEGKTFHFRNALRSVTASSILTTLRAMEYFINSERAYVTMYHAYTDAVERRRPELAQKYTNNMAIFVQNTSYSQVIEKIQKESPL
jgi:hypothetical protein